MSMFSSVTSVAIVGDIRGPGRFRANAILQRPVATACPDLPFVREHNAQDYEGKCRENNVG